MNGQCMILCMEYMNCIMIQQMADSIVNSNQVLTDYANLLTLATNWNNEMTELTFENKHHYNGAQLFELMLKVENDSRYKLLEPETSIIIRQLRLKNINVAKEGALERK